MRRFYSRKLRRHVVMLRAGEYFVSTKGEVLFTLLGSCIATCLYDAERKIGGMNHFLLPGMVHPEDIFTSEVGRYGMYAMELLIGELIKNGARREYLQAKVFGGGNVLRFRTSDGDVTGSNIRFASKFLELEGIPPLCQDVGGNKGRKLLFFSDTAKVLLKRFDVEKDPETINEENDYKRRVFKTRQDKKGSVILF
ncbi:MAG: chemotaxis protein CheD [Desulfatibacillaceae bacterium]